MHPTRQGLIAAIGLFATAAAAQGGDGHAPPTFERDVRPIFKAYCLDCHGGGSELKGKLYLRLARTARRGGKTGAAVVPGKPDESPLLDRVRDGEMPPGEKKLPPDQAAIIERWIAAGAKTLRAEPESLPPGIDITPEERAFWAFQPVHRPDPPAVAPEDAARVRTPIDAFLLAELRHHGATFSPEADRTTLLRRAALDLTGLPPSPDDLAAFRNDRRPGAYERAIDRLLDSPHYGERWARHWLDVAGYADSDGDGTEDTPRPYSYRYRDYVVRSFNADKPLDRFIVEQLAGDELVPRPWTNLKPDQAELLAATGFLRMAADATSSGAPDLALASNQVVADTLKIVGSTFLGLTVGCAQCHDHKYDPIPQADYYRLRAVFEPALDPSQWRRPSQRLVSLATDADRARSAAIEADAQKLEKALEPKVARYLDEALEKELTKFPDALRGKLRDARKTPEAKRTAEQKKLLASNPSVNISEGVLYQYNQPAADDLKKEREKIAAVRAKKPIEDFVSVLDEVPGRVPITHVFYRGDHRQPTTAVLPGDLTIAAPPGGRFEVAGKDPKLPTSGRRLAYARHLVDGRHPLVGRVLVNRIWMHHFGRGLVESAGDFGALGTRPTHPELLDWLATELVHQGWSLKQMHRLILTSSAYRQSSRRTSAGDTALDAWYARYPVRRLDAEALRDRVLFTSGRLDPTLYGRPVPVAEDAVGQVNAAGDSPRRSLYLEVKRTRPVSLLAAFDAPAMAVNCDRRTASTSAPQSLMLMNSDFILDHAKAMATRIRSGSPAAKGGKPDPDAMLARAWTLAYQRPITADERALARAFLKAQLDEMTRTNTPGDRELAALADLCQQLLTSNEFLYVD